MKAIKAIFLTIFIILLSALISSVLVLVVIPAVSIPMDMQKFISASVLKIFPISFFVLTSITMLSLGLLSFFIARYFKLLENKSFWLVNAWIALTLSLFCWYVLDYLFTPGNGLHIYDALMTYGLLTASTARALASGVLLIIICGISSTFFLKMMKKAMPYRSAVIEE